MGRHWTQWSHAHGSLDPAQYASLALTHVQYHPDDPLAYPLSLVTLSPPFLIVTYVAFLLVRRELTVAFGFAGQLACEAFNLFLKRLFKQGRPTDYLGTGYGMPSSHSQFVGYFAAFWCLHLLRFRPGMAKAARTAELNASRAAGSPKASAVSMIGILRSLEHYALLAMVLLGSALTAYSRYHLSYHTALQIFVGLGLGSGCGVAWYVVVEVLMRTPLFGMRRSIRHIMLDNPFFVAFRIRDSWAVWDDAGVEAEYGLWRQLYDQSGREKDMSDGLGGRRDENDLQHMLHALRLASRCEQTTTAFSVGCVIVDSHPARRVIATGYSRETPGNTHAEEVALDRLMKKASTSGGKAKETANLSLYTTMEPCSERLSKKDACVQRILAFNRANVVIEGVRLQIDRIVQGVREPGDFVECAGTRMLQDHGLTVVHLDGGRWLERDGRTLQLNQGWLEREAVRLAKHGHPDQPSKRDSEDLVWREEGWKPVQQQNSTASSVQQRHQATSRTSKRRA